MTRAIQNLLSPVRHRVAPARRGRVPAHGRAAARVLQPPAVLRPGPARGLRQVAASASGASAAPARPSGSRPGTSGPRSVPASRSRPPGGGTSAATAWSGSRASSPSSMPTSSTLQEVALLDADGDLHDQPAELARLTGLARPLRARSTPSRSSSPRDGPGDRRRRRGATRSSSRDRWRDGFALGPAASAPTTTLVEPAGSRPAAGRRPLRDAPYGTREPRCAVGGRLAGAGPRVAIVDAHLTYVGHASSGGPGRGAAPPLADGSAAPVIVTGDFNAPIEAPETARGSRPRSIDAFAAVGIPPGDPRRAIVRPAIDRPRPRPRPATSRLPRSPTRPATRPITGRSWPTLAGRADARPARVAASAFEAVPRAASTWSASSASRARAPSTTAAGARSDERVVGEARAGGREPCPRPRPAPSRAGRDRARRASASAVRRPGPTASISPPATMIVEVARPRSRRVERLGRQARARAGGRGRAARWPGASASNVGPSVGRHATSVVGATSPAAMLRRRAGVADLADEAR